MVLRATLGMEFGTRKAKKQILSQTENAVIQGEAANDLSIVKNDAIQQAFLESIKETAGDMPTRQDMAAAIEDSKPKPRANLDAAHPALVYPIDRLVGVQVLQSINVDDWLQKTKDQEEVMTHSRYVSKRLQSIAQSGDLSKLKVLRYMLMLIDFFQLLKTVRGRKTNAKQIPKVEVIKEKLNVSNQLIDGLIARFTDKRYASGEFYI
jgi:DNA-directed RNA polymerase I subunit RPA49